MIKKEDVVKIGQFNKPHGIHGELSFTFTSDIFDRCDSPYFICEMDGILVPFFIDEYRFRSENGALVKLEKIESDTDARVFTNKEVFYPLSYIHEDEEVHAGDKILVGFTLCDEKAGEIGEIVEVDDSTMNILFVVETPAGEEILIPAVDDYVVSLDAQAKKIVMNIPEGLLDL
ncbi:MAG: ribosome maturation factor RimM [Bacteroidales bacterium]